MKIKHLKIKTFRNILNVETYLNSNIVCITGLNGAGKTNFLDVVTIYQILAVILIISTIIILITITMNFF
jgi:recombinational DNA repair ATPase RecF